MSQQPRRLFPMIPILKDRPIPSPKDFRDEFSPTWKTFTRFHKKGKIIFLDLFPLLERKFHQHWISLALSFTLTPRLCVCVSLEKSDKNTFPLFAKQKLNSVGFASCSDCLLEKHQILNLRWHIAVLYFSVIWVVKSS